MLRLISFCLIDDVGDHDRLAAAFLAGVGGFHEGVNFDRFFARSPAACLF